MQCMDPLTRIHSDHEVVAVVVPEVPKATIDAAVDVGRVLTVFGLCICHADTSAAGRPELRAIRIEFRKVPLSIAAVEGILNIASTSEAIGPDLPHGMAWPAGHSGPVQILHGVRGACEGPNDRRRCGLEVVGTDAVRRHHS